MTGLAQPIAERLACACFAGILAVAFAMLAVMAGDMMRGRS